MLGIAFHRAKYLLSIEFPDRASAKDNKMNYIKRIAKIYGSRLKIYATSVAGSAAEEGIEASTAGALEEGVEDPVAVVEEAVRDRIRDTNLGAYSFAFLKNSVISTKGTAYEAPTFS
jgi:hypothetical protein